MTVPKHTFTIELAGVPIEISCRYEENREFFEGYYSEEKPLVSIDTVGHDLEPFQRAYDALDAKDGLPQYRRTDPFLENTLIHTLLASELIAHNVLLMHGSALCMDGQAYIFSAPSGTGKSTHARLWRETFGDRVFMINDDKPMLRIDGDNISVYGTPWNGKHHLGRNTSAPLKAIIRLSRGETNLITPLSKADALKLLLNQAIKTRNTANMQTVISLEMKLLRQIDFYALTCTMDPEAALVAWRGMNE